jgi:hypothetical protein
MWVVLIWECYLTIPDNFDDRLAGHFGPPNHCPCKIGDLISASANGSTEPQLHPRPHGRRLWCRSVSLGELLVSLPEISYPQKAALKMRFGGYFVEKRSTHLDHIAGLAPPHHNSSLPWTQLLRRVLA